MPIAKPYSQPEGPPDQQPYRGRGWSSARQFKAERMDRLFGPDYQWEYVQFWYDRKGVKSATGSRITRIYKIRCRVTGRELLVGKGELVKYAKCGHTLPRIPRGRRLGGSLNRLEFDKHFVAAE